MSPEGEDKVLDPALVGTDSEQTQAQLPPDLPLSPRQYGQNQVTAIRPQSQYMDDYPSGLFTTDLPSGALTPSGLLGYGVEIDLDFSAIDLSFLSTYNTRAPFEVQTPVVSYADPTPQTTIDTPRTQDENASHNSSNRVLHNSIWRFVPVPGVGGYSDQTDLSIAVQDQSAGTPESLVDVRKRATNEEVDAVARDKILAILFSQVRSHILPAPAFPSVMLLDKLIQFFLDGPTPSARNWIHTASFSPKKARPELLLAMAAAGAVLTPDRSLRKLGFAMQEVVRNHAPTVWEADNTLVRDLEMSQAYMLQLAIGLWSGSSRKVEIAESFQQPLLSMLRRGGRFKRLNYPRQIFGSEDEGFVLERKWRAWVEQESFKRLVYHLLVHDAQASMSLLVNPAVSYSELELPLPEPQDLWLAGSAKEWKRIYQANPDLGVTRIPSLTDCVANPNLMQYNRAVIDLKLSCSSFLYAMWGMVWEYRKLARLFHTELNRSTIWDSRISLMTRYHELVKVFDYYRVSYPDESVLLLELVLMHLHMSLEEVQHFCGLESAEDTNTVHASFKEWADSKTARSAVWHAGQVVRGIRALPATHLRDFYAISLFHASLALWTFGLASPLFVPNRENRREDAGHAADLSQVVYLDDEETSATYRYITLARGTPGLHDCRPDRWPVPLDDLTGVMNAMMQLMDRSDGEPSTPNSPMVENLLNMMGRIRDTALNEGTTL
jgi:hypothetical protein